jgi:hypothetical protein
LFDSSPAREPGKISRNTQYISLAVVPFAVRIMRGRSRTSRFDPRGICKAEAGKHENPTSQAGQRGQGWLDYALAARRAYTGVIDPFSVAWLHLKGWSRADGEQSMKGNMKKLMLPLLLGVVLAGVGCKDDGTAEGVGRDLDRAGEKAKDNLEKAGEKTGEAVEKAGDKIEDATN